VGFGGRRAGEARQATEGDADGEQVRACVGSVAAEDFGGEERGGSGDACGGGHVEGAGAAEVDEDAGGVGADEDVGGFEVVADAGAVQETKGVEGVEQGREGLVPGVALGVQVEGDADDGFGRVEAGGLGEGGVDRGGEEPEVMDGAEGGVGDALEGSKLEAKGFDERGQVGPEQLEGELDLIDQVVDEIGGGGAALAEGGEDIVAIGDAGGGHAGTLSHA